MPKRFLDSALFDEEDFIEANPEQKILALYLISNACSIGIFKQSFKIISFKLGFEVNEDLLFNCPVKVEKLDKKRYWLPNFCAVQYGPLSKKSVPHRSYIKKLKEEGLLDRVKLAQVEEEVDKGQDTLGGKGIDTLEDKAIGSLKEKEKEKDKEKDKEKKKESIEEIKKRKIEEFSKEAKKAFEEIGEGFHENELQRFVDYWVQSKPKGKLLLWEMQKVFEVKRRLKAWLDKSARPQNFRRPQNKESHSTKELKKFAKTPNLQQRILNGEFGGES